VEGEEVGPGQPGGDGEVAFGVARPPPGDLAGVGGGVEEPVLGGRDLLPRDAGEHRPARLGVPQRRSEPGVRALLPGHADRLAGPPAVGLRGAGRCQPVSTGGTVGPPFVVVWPRPPGAVMARSPVLDQAPGPCGPRAGAPAPRTGTGRGRGPVRAAEGWPRSR